MYVPEQAAARGIAFLWYREHRRGCRRQALDWSRRHWMEFLDEVETTATGRMLVQVFAGANRREGTEKTRRDSGR
jgi:hypothetical protein